ncbi:Protoporphyrinogen oxidase [Suhomyces tanzawaensis NRRL Y-17324]|uniref:Protoporphyrinogen oxidase n=1 Tax=Suhomyces tanzawaensis NRRL Y-17324 TaxID=984487 RepID=A0A1E4SIB1_9ASCO|nr:Protoporphyrinogen oxidase [Suhomyces tanzawaensis NRRL Y-17324]ODV79177.1 Protoporphyrinogen oxidase [Suhomyces tanzawaensis NRRL Y-17324]
MTLTIPPNGKVAVIGAGVSGLSFAYFLNKLRPDINIHIFEKKPHVGGWIDSLTLSTKSGDSILLEKGPRTLRGVSDGSLLIVDILKNLGLAQLIEVIEKSSVANKKYLLDHSRELLQVPDSVQTGAKFLAKSGILKFELLKGFFKEPFVPQRNDGKDESIESFFQRRLGSKLLTNNVMSAVLHGIYAGDISKLSVRTVLPKVVELENEKGSIFKTLYARFREKKEKEATLPQALKEYEDMISPESNLTQLSSELKKFPMLKLLNGLQEFPRKIEEYLTKQNKVHFHFRSNITSVSPKGELAVEGEEAQKFHHIRSTIYTHELARLLPKESSELSDTLARLQYVNVFLVNIYSPKVELKPKEKQGFGFLVPKGEDGRFEKNPDCLLGVIFDSDVEQNSIKFIGGEPVENGNASKITLMMGGHYYNKIQIPSAGINLKIVKKILSEILKVDLSESNLIIRDEESIESKDIQGLKSNDILISYNLHKNCIPQYNVGYGDIKNELESWIELNNSKLSFGGMAFGNGIGVPDCVTNALEHALKCK